jgi:hypothetical protein
MVGEPSEKPNVANGWQTALAIGFLIVTLSLAGCDLTEGLPDSGFVTRYVMGWQASSNSASPVASGASEPHPYADEVCRDLALTRASDAQASQSAELSAVDWQRIVDLTYDDCVKWRTKGALRFSSESAGP